MNELNGTRARVECLGTIAKAADFYPYLLNVSNISINTTLTDDSNDGD